MFEDRVCGVRRVDQIRSDRVRERCGSKMRMYEKAEESMLI